ncbi:hypothetical protein MB27_08120 [Actinoplanes utahensis]|uniref:Uncharacterized protein n=1 Tax=Actinoplanes utahensis TaxID=1869 RepID=A0A0A6UST1_ACTUT|nr:hypothetical protein MB27_08120 [Actinoplanes utahensis]
MVAGVSSDVAGVSSEVTGAASAVRIPLEVAGDARESEGVEAATRETAADVSGSGEEPAEVVAAIVAGTVTAWADSVAGVVSAAGADSVAGVAEPERRPHTSQPPITPITSPATK